MDDFSLIDGLRQRDPEAVRYLHETCLPAVWRFAFVRVKGDRHLAEDIVSEATLVLLKAVADPNLRIESPTSWLRTVVANKVVDYFRAVTRVQHLINQVQAVPSSPSDQSAIQDQLRRERQAEIRGVLESLPEQTQIALEWKYVDKVGVREISRRLGISEKAVESLLFRGRREFREKLLRQQRLEDHEISNRQEHSRQEVRHEGRAENSVSSDESPLCRDVGEVAVPKVSRIVSGDNGRAGPMRSNAVRSECADFQ